LIRSAESGEQGRPAGTIPYPGSAWAVASIMQMQRDVAQQIVAWGFERARDAARLGRPEAPVRDLRGLPASLGRIGSLEVRLATTRKEIRRAQRLRYKVFYEEMGAIPDAVAMLSRRDKDDFDRICDHLIVVDHAAPSKVPGAPPKPRTVGAYRLLRQDIADRNFGFYSESEFDIGAAVRADHGARLLELGRSCVHKDYRNKRTVELLWHGVWSYVLHHRIDRLFGCASFEGTDPRSLALPLSFLRRHAPAEGAWDIRARPGRGSSMDILQADDIDPRAALSAMPPLIKGYLRLGATFGREAVIDRQFGATDVFVLLDVAKIERRYIEHFGADASRHAA
jgi:L-ornithine Nalpha-acyltransferase